MISQHEVDSQQNLEYLGIRNVNNIYWNLPTPALYEQVIRRREGLLAHLGPLVVRTGSITGRVILRTKKFCRSKGSHAVYFYAGSI